MPGSECPFTPLRASGCCGMQVGCWYPGCPHCPISTALLPKGNCIGKAIAALASASTACCCPCRSSELVCLKESVRFVLL